MKSTFEIFLSTVYPDWPIDFPDLPDYVEPFVIESGEFLPGQLGDIYFVGEGSIGKYEKSRPKRYILPRELIFTPLTRHRYQFIALEKSVVYFLDRKKLYELAAIYPKHIVLYDLLREQHQKEMDIRAHLLSLDKIERLEAFRLHYRMILGLVARQELAKFLCVSREYLRLIF